MTKKEQSTLKKILKSRFFVVVLIIILVVVASSYIRAFYQDYKVKQEIESLQNKVNSLEKKKIESMELLEYVTSKSFVEDKARTDLNMKKPGENAMIVKEADGVNSSNNSDKQNKNKPNPVKWWQYFTNNYN